MYPWQHLCAGMQRQSTANKRNKSPVSTPNAWPPPGDALFKVVIKGLGVGEGEVGVHGRPACQAHKAQVFGDSGEVAGEVAGEVVGEESPWS